MKNTFFISYALWVVGAITLKIVGWVSWWVATSWLWLPLAIIITLGTFIFGAAKIGDRLKARQEAKIPNTCANCLFSETRKFDADGKCLGEKLSEGHTYGTICGHYRRYR